MIRGVLLSVDFVLGLLLAHKTWQYCNLIGQEIRCIQEFLTKVFRPVLKNHTHLSKLHYLGVSDYCFGPE